MNLTVRGVENDRKGQGERGRWLLGAAAVLPVVTLAVLFLPWDLAGRTSFGLLATAERIGVFPDWFPATPVLMWWVLLPVLLAGASVGEAVGLVKHGRAVWALWTRAALQFPAQASVFVVAFGVTRSPVAGVGATVALYVSAVGIIGVFAGAWGARRG